jgi:hypothetical protein
MQKLARVENKLFNQLDFDSLEIIDKMSRTG